MLSNNNKTQANGAKQYGMRQLLSKYIESSAWTSISDVQTFLNNNYDHSYICRILTIKYISLIKLYNNYHVESYHNIYTINNLTINPNESNQTTLSLTGYLYTTLVVLTIISYYSPKFIQGMVQIRPVVYYHGTNPGMKLCTGTGTVWIVHPFISRHRYNNIRGGIIVPGTVRPLSYRTSTYGMSRLQAGIVLPYRTCTVR